MKHKVLFQRLIKLKYNTIYKHQIATGYSNFLTQFSVSLNNLLCAYISIITIAIVITTIISIIIIITVIIIIIIIVIVTIIS